MAPTTGRRKEALLLLEFAAGSNPTEEEIKRRFKELARKYHPDVNDGNDAKFKEIHRAYQTLLQYGELPPIDRDALEDILFGQISMITKKERRA